MLSQCQMSFHIQIHDPLNFQQRVEFWLKIKTTTTAPWNAACVSHVTSFSVAMFHFQVHLSSQMTPLYCNMLLVHRPNRIMSSFTGYISEVCFTFFADFQFNTSVNCCCLVAYVMPNCSVLTSAIQAIHSTLSHYHVVNIVLVSLHQSNSTFQIQPNATIVSTSLQHFDTQEFLLRILSRVLFLTIFTCSHD